MGANLLPDLRLGRIMRHVPLKLRVERGQHLDTFLNTFVASTEAPRPKPRYVVVIFTEILVVLFHANKVKFIFY